jgi:hypothetical protein
MCINSTRILLAPPLALSGTIVTNSINKPIGGLNREKT